MILTMKYYIYLMKVKNRKHIFEKFQTYLLARIELKKEIALPKFDLFKCQLHMSLTSKILIVKRLNCCRNLRRHFTYHV